MLKQETYNCLKYYEEQILHLNNCHRGIIELMNNEHSQDLNKLLTVKKIVLFSSKLLELQIIFQQHIPGMSISIVYILMQK